MLTIDKIKMAFDKLEAEHVSDDFLVRADVYEKLTKKANIGDKEIETTAGVFKMRKNGKYWLVIGSGKHKQVIRASLVH